MRWVQSVHPLAAKLGVKMRMPSVVPRTRLAHEAAAWARAKGQADAMHDAIFRAFFERSEDIGQIDVLAALAAGAGLDAADLQNSLTLHSHLPKVLADEQQAQNYGLTGVPAFIWNGKGLVGVQTDKNLERLVDSV
jgi:predicted DsbA family dithiol-disulfide isomerase